RTFVLEAGAMPLTNGGLLCIDELDKMNKDDRSALHSALEQQIIAVSKANIHATLVSQTSVLAAANPKLGRFNPYDVVAAQIDLPPTLINRFDLIFIMQDKPNPEVDKMVAEKILEANKDIDKNKPAIDVNLFRKYIAYARQKSKPILSDDAMKTINEFYLKLRSSVSNEDEKLRPIPISARQLEAIIRLAEASAKVRLSNYVMPEDAKRAIDLIMAYLGEVGVDKSTGNLDIDRIAVGISTSQRSIVLSVKSIISNEINSLPSGSSVPISTIYGDAEKSGISKEQVDDAISILKREGEIFEPRMGFIKMLV
ncbi:MAG: ATP-binding protein, partial [Nanoarchaeota archaeon]|nr:ATP-binding protein [Nanoarchaeota archaeon]